MVMDFDGDSLYVLLYMFTVYKHKRVHKVWGTKLMVKQMSQIY